VGINLLREGLDLPEVSLVAILAFMLTCVGAIHWIFRTGWKLRP